MGFSTTTITDGPVCSEDGGELRVWWATSAPAGTLFQVYLDRRLAWTGTATTARLPMPQGRAYADVISVDPGDGGVDYSASLPALDGLRAEVEWSGGRFLDETLAGFNIYSSAAPGGPVGYSKPVAFVPWAPFGIACDGFGIGGFGNGGFGRSEVRYAWASGVLARGVWTFGVRTLDRAGNLGTASEASYTIAGPPRPPAPYPGGARLRLAVDPSTRVPTLTWLPSPT